MIQGKNMAGVTCATTVALSWRQLVTLNRVRFQNKIICTRGFEEPSQLSVIRGLSAKGSPRTFKSELLWDGPENATPTFFVLFRQRSSKVDQSFRKRTCTYVVADYLFAPITINYHFPPNSLLLSHFHVPKFLMGLLQCKYLDIPSLFI